MKNKNIVHDKNKKTPFYKDRKGILVVVLLLLMFLLTAISMPMANIPLLGRMGSLFGLTDESMRALTLSDFAAYTFGVEGGGRLASVRNSQYSVYESSGGLSPFSVQSSNRLLDAKRAYLKEFEKTGRYNTIAGSASGLDIEDPEGVGISDMYMGGAVAPSIDNYTGAAAADGYGQPFVKPFDDGYLDQAYTESSVTATDENGNLVLRGSDRSKIVKPSGAPGKIMSARSDENNMYFQALDNKAKRLNGGRLGAFGGINAMTNRMRTSVGAGRQMGAFGTSGRDMGRVYYLSATATGQKYNDVAKNVAESAWDGGEIESEDLVAVGEETEKVLNSLEPPSNIVQKAGAARGACAAAKKAYNEALNEAGKSFISMKSSLLETGNGTPKGIPGYCGKGLHPRVYAKRQAWNAMVDSMVSQCESLRSTADKYSGTCGLNYKEDVSCTNLKQLKLRGHGGIKGAMPKCRKRPERADNGKRISLEDVDSIIDKVVKGAGLDGTTNSNFF